MNIILRDGIIHIVFVNAYHMISVLSTQCLMLGMTDLNVLFVQYLKSSMIDLGVLPV